MKKALFITLLIVFNFCMLLQAAEYLLNDKDEGGTTKYYGFQLQQSTAWYGMSVSSTTVGYTQGISTTTYSDFWTYHSTTTYHSAFDYQKSQYLYPN